MESICRKFRVGDELPASGHFGRATEGDDFTPLRQAGAVGFAVGLLLFFDDSRVLVWNTYRFASLEQECLSGT